MCVLLRWNKFLSLRTIGSHKLQLLRGFSARDGRVAAHTQIAPEGYQRHFAKHCTNR
jgi:hypothetical protein